MTRSALVSGTSRLCGGSSLADQGKDTDSSNPGNFANDPKKASEAGKKGGDTLCVSFCGWNQVDRFMAAWREAGFRPVGHVVLAKDYPSSSRFLAHHHEQAYVLAKGDPALPSQARSDVQGGRYTGNRLHPAEKSPATLAPLAEAFCPAGGVMFNPFCEPRSSLGV